LTVGTAYNAITVGLGSSCPTNITQAATLYVTWCTTGSTLTTGDFALYRVTSTALPGRPAPRAGRSSGPTTSSRRRLDRLPIIHDMSGLSIAPAPTADPLPSIDWAGVAAQQAGSTISCTNGVLLTAATFSLTPGSSYSCSITDSTGTSTLGSINYNATNHTLALSGVVYFSGSLNLSTTSPVTYTGIGSLFVAGTVIAANGSALCVHVASGTCDMANANTTGNADYWDTTKSVLIIQAQGAVTAANFASREACTAASPSTSAVASRRRRDRSYPRCSSPRDSSST